MQVNVRSKFATDWLGPKYVEVPVEKRSDPEGTPAPTVARLRRNPGAVSINDALTISAVYASVNVINNWVSQMDLEVYRGSEELPAPSIVAAPEIASTQYGFIKKTVTSLALTGNAYWRVTRRQSDGVPIELEVLNPLAMAVEEENGKKVYHYTGYTKPRRYTAREVLHIMTFEVPGRLTGLSPLEAGGAGLGAILALRRYADEWFGGSGTVRQHFTYAYEMDDDQRAEWVRRIKIQKAENDGDLYTGGDTKVNNLALTPADAMYADQASAAMTEVARWFGIPAGLVLADSGATGMTYQNLATDARLFVTSTLSGYMRPIEEAFTGLLPRGQVVRFRTEALLRGQTQERYEAYSTAITAGFMTVNEVREREGMSPLAEAGPVPTTEEETNNES